MKITVITGSPRKDGNTFAMVADDVAMVAIDSQFDDAKYTDMFTLVKDGDDWKIVSKVYHTK